MNKTAFIATLAYGILILVGGVIGHLVAGSRASLIAGTLSGVLVLLSAWAIYKNKIWGKSTALILAILLDAFFTYRWMVTQKFMPAGMMSILSLLLIWILVRKNNAER